MSTKKILFSLGLTFTFGLIIILPVFGQDGPSGWSSPEKIFETSGRLAESSTTIVSDRAGQLHLFFTHRSDETESIGIDYMFWDGSKWTEPITVLLNKDGNNVSNVRAAIDKEQLIHLVWGGGGNTVYHAFSPALIARSAQNWSVPQAIANAFTETGVSVDQDNVLYVAYSDSESPGNLLIITSADAGATWSNPSLVATTDPGTVPGEIGAAVDEMGRVHVTWTGHTLPDGYPLTGVYYARSDDGGFTWSAPLQIDDERHGEIGVGTVGKDEIHLVWRSNIGGDGTFHQASLDGGQTWLQVDQYNDRGGQSGVPSFAVDSNGTLHFVIGPGYVSRWSDGRLAPYLDVVGSQIRQAALEDPSKSPGERSVLAITQGNQVHVVFETNFNKLWHTTSLIDAPTLSASPLPTLPATAQAASSSFQPSAASAQPIAQAVSEDNLREPVAFSRQRPGINSGNTTTAILLGLAPALLLVVGIVSYHLLRRSR